MRLKPSKSFEISLDKFDIGEFIAQMKLDSVAAIQAIEEYRREKGTEACADWVELCQHLLEKLRPAQPSLVEIQPTSLYESTLKATLFDLETPPSAVITMEGGLIQDIDTNMLMDILVLEFDTDCDPTDLIDMNGDKCTARSWQPAGFVETVENCWKQYHDSGKACITDA